MKPLSEMTHYEVLEVRPEASPEDVERAYRIASSTYGEDSLATYSLYDESEVSAIRERIEQAYRVLASNEARDDYDHSLGGRHRSAEAARVEIQLDFDEVNEVVHRLASPEVEEFADLEDPSDGNFDGARLRRTRLARTIEIERIAEVTKIGPNYLLAIEEERYGDLPADVYVRGFVSAYAKCVGLDPERVAAFYMERLRSSRRQPTAGMRLKSPRR